MLDPHLVLRLGVELALALGLISGPRPRPGAFAEAVRGVWSMIALGQPPESDHQ